MFRHANHLRAALLLAAAAQVSTIAACGSREPAGQAAGETLGFETTARWVVEGGAASLSRMRTQGAAALSLAPWTPAGEVVARSGALSSDAPQLAGLGTAGARILLDVRVESPLPRCGDLPGNVKPATQECIPGRSPGNGNGTKAVPPGHERFGIVHLWLDCPSRGLHNATLGMVKLDGMTEGVFQTIKFMVPDAVSSALAGAPYQDVSFRLVVSPAGWLKGTYTLDNLRTRSLEQPVPPPSRTVGLEASLAYAPPASRPGEATFPLSTLQVPQSFHLVEGRAGAGTATLELGSGAATEACTYVAMADGSGYRHSTCDGALAPGDILAVDAVRLTIRSSDPAAGTARIRAQLAGNPMGDVVGAGLLPPMPTWWGDSAASTNQIASDYFASIPTTPPDEETWILAPVGDFARRRGDPAPRSTPPTHRLGVPLPGSRPTALVATLASPDLALDKSSHLNEGGSWDASWRVRGALRYGELTQVAAGDAIDFQTILSADAVIWDAPVTLLALEGSAHADATGYYETQSLTSDVLGGVSLPIGTEFSHELADIRIWIFSIKPGVWATTSIARSGTLSRLQLSAYRIEPAATVGLTLYGGVDVVIASGGLDARVELLGVTTPITADVAVGHPDACTATRSAASLAGEVTLSSAGGQVSLVAKFGVCPFCKRESWPIFDWASLASFTQAFPASTADQVTVTYATTPDGQPCSCTDKSYRDADGDGFGDPNQMHCGPASGYVPDARDCNDENITVHPGAIERCGDGLANSCGGACEAGCLRTVHQKCLDPGACPGPSCDPSSPITVSTCWDSMLTGDLAEGPEGPYRTFVTYASKIDGVTEPFELQRCYNGTWHYVATSDQPCPATWYEGSFGYPVLATPGDAKLATGSSALTLCKSFFGLVTLPITQLQSGASCEGTRPHNWAPGGTLQDWVAVSAGRSVANACWGP